ncbi:MAG: GTPase Era [Flavobacteriaceae bacterium]|jgi:GTP-binding protein Era|nr:GTPase Era [Flavobacteriaceae bacterium]MBT7458720.1 GTPase Era [Flavobacteriaceae bacterium]MCH1385249.1 GTPase Era [Flavobacteriaceae bacterium]
MHKAGFVNIIGNPNAGKSTLMNALMDQKLSIITAKAQTTRHRILGIYNTAEAQVIFSDTPGIIKPDYALQERMMDATNSSFDDADVMLLLIATDDKREMEEKTWSRIKSFKGKLLLVLNKVDLSDQKKLEEIAILWQSKLPDAELWSISATENFRVLELRDRVLSLLPNHPPFFPKDQVTDKPERFFVNESIREQILLRYQKEIPYAVEVVTEQFEETEKIIRIRSLIIVERNSQKGIIVGSKGSAIKSVGVGARKSLENFFGKKVHLELFVKVNKNWRSNSTQLQRFGYSSSQKN